MPPIKKSQFNDPLEGVPGEGSDAMLEADLEAEINSAHPEVPMKRPDITPAQIVASVPVIAALLRAFGVYDLTEDQQAALRDAIDYALVLVGADAVIRVGRSLSKRWS